MKWLGDDSFEWEVVWESHYQDALSAICGGRTAQGHEHYCDAVLKPESDNPYDKNAVAVFIEGRKVAHLQAAVAKAYCRMLKNTGMQGAAIACDAVIVGGWEHKSGDSGHFGVKLDIASPMELES